MSVPGISAEWRWIPVWQQTNPTDPTSKTLWAGTTAYAILADPRTPDASTTWTASDTRSGYTGASIGGYGAGVWHAYAKITSSPDTPVVDCGTFVKS